MGTGDLVADQIRLHALERGLRAGERLPSERDLAKALGVSRPSVREGLRRLAERGVVESRRGSGTYLSDVDPRALLEVRLLLEPHAASRAATTMSVADRKLLLKAAARLKSLLNHPNEFAALDAEIHQALADASGNEVLTGILASLHEPLGRSREATVQDLELRASAAADMREVALAVAEGRVRDARDHMRRHLLEVEKRLGPVARA